MQTLYIDVYFLINFTVDLIALHLASEFTKIKIKSTRLLVFTFLLSLVASIEVFLPSVLLSEIFVNLACIFFVFITPKRGIGMKRRIKFFVTAYTLLMLIGGVVYAAFNYLKQHASLFESEQTVNRKLLILSIIVLISVGCVKIFVSLLKDARCERSVKLDIYMNDKRITVDCFVDTGNFLKDPIDMTPVMLLKSHVAENIFPQGIPIEITDSIIGKSINVRLIPIKRGDGCEIRLGFRPQKAEIVSDSGKREVDICFIIDNERGSYSGYDGLVPASLVE